MRTAMKKFYGTVIAVAIALTSTSALALECTDPKGFVESVKDQALVTINSEGSDSEKRAKLDQLFREVADIEWMGKFVLGRSYAKLTPEQQKEYSTVYADYLSNSYVDRFRKYNGQKIEVTQVKPLNSDFVVNTTVDSQDGKQPIAVTYRLRKVGSCFKLADINAEGISLLNTQRQEFTSVVNSRGTDGLLESLKKKLGK